MITGQVHHILMTVGRPMTTDEVAGYCIYLVPPPPMPFQPARGTVQQSLRELLREGLAVRRGAKYTGTWNGLAPLPTGQTYRTRLPYMRGNGDRQGPVQPQPHGYEANPHWVRWIADTITSR